MLEFGYTSDFYSYEGVPVALLGPKSAFTSPSQEQLFVEMLEPYLSIYQINRSSEYPYASNVVADTNSTLSTRSLLGSSDAIISQITNHTNSFDGFGIWAPSGSETIFYHHSSAYKAQTYIHAFSYLTNRIANTSTTTGTAKISTANIRTFTHVNSTVGYLSMPVTVLLILAFITAASIAVIYPTFERVNRVRALQYCNGVSPFALWVGHLLFDVQFIVIQSCIVWGIMFAESLQRLYFESNYILGVLILFGIATYLGTYVLSLFVKKAAFAIAAGLHILLFVLYFVGYIVTKSVGATANRYQTYSLTQYVVGLTSSGANLARALFVSMKMFGVLCGKYGDDESPAMSYARYGSVYINLIIQIIFITCFLAIHEYGRADWFRCHITHCGSPARLHYTIANGKIPTISPNEKQASETNTTIQAKADEILVVSQVSKFFGRVFAAENISFAISSNETLALLGGNCAGKTTIINLICGELKPDYGDITLNSTSVLRNPHKARLHMGVCPQDDAIDNLTVRQTLSFYASVKGLKNVSGNVDKVLKALNIGIYEHLVVKALSGGTKRKLSVAIALLDNPRVLLLDEPSTGQDAGAKRVLWKTLQDVSKGRAILLTTHSMEEAEALASEVAIMGTRMLATGTLAQLQERYGGLYSVRAVRIAGVSAGEAEEAVKEAVGGGEGGGVSGFAWAGWVWVAA